MKVQAVTTTMLAISTSASAALPSFQQAASPQLRRAAEQAQQAAETLQTQARQAWEQVDLAEANARAIDTRANQAVSGADKARRDMNSFGKSMLATDAVASPASAIGGAIAPITYTATAQATTLPSASPAMLNGLGQRIGELINITV